MQKPRLVVATGAVLLLGSAFYSLAADDQKESAVPVTTDKSGFASIKGLLDTYCITCHSGAKPESDITLSFSDEAAARSRMEADPDFWSAVARVVRMKEMPPEKAKAKPTDDERGMAVKWVTEFTGGGKPNPGRFVVHRLNNREYANTIRDLFYLPDNYDASADFPADERGDGFDNNSDTLTISPLLIEHYLEAAERTVAIAMNIDGKGNRSAQAKLNAATQGVKEDYVQWQQMARPVVEVFLPRAYRRPVTKEEIDEVMKFAALASTHEAGRLAPAVYPMRAAIMSPEFLFRLEHDWGHEGEGRIFQIDEFQLASRLSYFLWSSMPDDELFAAAKAGKLRSNLEDQIKRMLKSPKSISLTEGFMGQWLEIRGLDKTTNCPPDLLAAMKGETEHFFNYIVKEDRSIMEFLDADYTFVNQKLAEHYGIQGVTGDAFQKVPVDTEQRGGIFTQASFLTLTAKPLGASRRTSPVNRGKWILENIFDTKIPLPPPNVPALPVDDGVELKGTVRQIFEQHRENPDCVNCHKRMDPYGFALENYDGFGVWRTQDNHVDVDASGEINGKKYSTPREFRTILADRKDDFRRALITKLLSYSLGRGVATYDQSAIDAICAAVKKDDDRVSSVILNLVNCYPFQHARGSQAEKTQEINR